MSPRFNRRWEKTRPSPGLLPATLTVLTSSRNPSDSPPDENVIASVDSGTHPALATILTSGREKGANKLGAGNGSPLGVGVGCEQTQATAAPGQNTQLGTTPTEMSRPRPPLTTTASTAASTTASTASSPSTSSATAQAQPFGPEGGKGGKGVSKLTPAIKINVLKDKYLGFSSRGYGFPALANPSATASRVSAPTNVWERSIKLRNDAMAKKEGGQGKKGGEVSSSTQTGPPPAAGKTAPAAGKTANEERGGTPPSRTVGSTVGGVIPPSKKVGPISTDKEALENSMNEYLERQRSSSTIVSPPKKPSESSEYATAASASENASDKQSAERAAFQPRQDAPEEGLKSETVGTASFCRQMKNCLQGNVFAVCAINSGLDFFRRLRNIAPFPKKLSKEAVNSGAAKSAAELQTVESSESQAGGSTGPRVGNANVKSQMSPVEVSAASSDEHVSLMSISPVPASTTASPAPSAPTSSERARGQGLDDKGGKEGISKVSQADKNLLAKRSCAPANAKATASGVSVVFGANKSPNVWQACNDRRFAAEKARDKEAKEGQGKEEGRVSLSTKRGQQSKALKGQIPKAQQAIVANGKRGAAPPSELPPPCPDLSGGPSTIDSPPEKKLWESREGKHGARMFANAFNEKFPKISAILCSAAEAVYDPVPPAVSSLYIELQAWLEAERPEMSPQQLATLPKSGPEDEELTDALSRIEEKLRANFLSGLTDLVQSLSGPLSSGEFSKCTLSQETSLALLFKSACRIWSVLEVEKDAIWILREPFLQLWSEVFKKP